MCFLEQLGMNLWKGDKPSVLAGDLYNLYLENKNITVKSSSTISDVQLKSFTTFLYQSLLEIGYTGCFYLSH